jgi:hypothetical protein
MRKEITEKRRRRSEGTQLLAACCLFLVETHTKRRTTNLSLTVALKRLAI